MVLGSVIAAVCHIPLLVEDYCSTVGASLSGLERLHVAVEDGDVL